MPSHRAGGTGGLWPPEHLTVGLQQHPKVLLQRHRVLPLLHLKRPHFNYPCSHRATRNANDHLCPPRVDHSEAHDPRGGQWRGKCLPGGCQCRHSSNTSSWWTVMASHGEHGVDPIHLSTAKTGRKCLRPPTGSLSQVPLPVGYYTTSPGSASGLGMTCRPRVPPGCGCRTVDPQRPGVLSPAVNGTYFKGLDMFSGLGGKVTDLGHSRRCLSCCGIFARGVNIPGGRLSFALILNECTD